MRRNTYLFEMPDGDVVETVIEHRYGYSLPVGSACNADGTKTFWSVAFGGYCCDVTISAAMLSDMFPDVDVWEVIDTCCCELDDDTED